MKRLAVLLIVLLLLTGCQNQQQGQEIVHFEDTDIYVLGDWRVDVSGRVGSVKGTVYNDSACTFDDLVITATVYDQHGVPIMNASTTIANMSPFRQTNFTIAKALLDTSSRQWETVSWEYSFRRQRIGFIEQVLSEMPEQHFEQWANIIYGDSILGVSWWPTIAEIDLRLATYAVEIGQTRNYDRSWLLRFPFSQPTWGVHARAFAIWHLTYLPEPFQTQEIDRIADFPFPTGTVKQRTFWDKWVRFLYTRAGYVQVFPSYEWILDEKTAAQYYPVVTNDLRTHCLQILQQ